MTTDPREAYTVVHVCQVWLPQTQTWLYGLVRHLPDHVASEVVAAQVRNLGQFPIGRLHTRHGSPGLLGRALRRITRAPDVGPVSSVVAAARPSIVHAHFGPVGWVVRDVARRVDSALVVSFYGLDVDYAPTVDHRWRARYRELFSAADRVLCLGPDMAGRLEGRGCPSRKLRIHHLGIDTDAIPYAPHPWTPDRPMRCLVAASFGRRRASRMPSRLWDASLPRRGSNSPSWGTPTRNLAARRRRPGSTQRLRQIRGFGSPCSGTARIRRCYVWLGTMTCFWLQVEQPLMGIRRHADDDPRDDGCRPAGRRARRMQTFPNSSRTAELGFWRARGTSMISSTGSAGLSTTQRTDCPWRQRPVVTWSSVSAQQFREGSSPRSTMWSELDDDIIYKCVRYQPNSERRPADVQSGARLAQGDLKRPRPDFPGS